MAKKKEAPAPDKIRLKKGDMVQVMVGRDKGKTGRILEVDRDRGRVLVEGAMMMKRHTRPNPAKQVKGGIAEREGFIHVSNVMAVTGNGTPTRIGYRIDDLGGGVTRRVRVARKTGEILDKKA
jgi:large subunit ribosomal protein L24